MNIRNFCIIAHIDHGKSTLADRMLEITGTIKKLEHGQILDTMDLEQERGITIKLTPARMYRKGYELNLIDTPGHADFQYEVSRSLAAVEGALLLVDASQGIQAQTLSTLYMALEQGLEIIPVINKIDLPAANPDKVAQEINHLLGVDPKEILRISGKTGYNVDKVLDAIVQKIPAPGEKKQADTAKVYQGQLARALIFDSLYDKYRGVVVYVKVLEGEFRAGMKLHLIHTNTDMVPLEVGYLNPKYNPDEALKVGQIGYIVTGKKSVRDAQIGDTIIAVNETTQKIHNLQEIAITGFKQAKPYVYAGVYPLDSGEYDKLKDSFAKLALNDSAITYEHENSKALGFGFRCGFLGMLHMDIVKERLEREYDISTIFTTPTVLYLAKVKSSSIEQIKSGKNLNDLRETGLRKEVLKFENCQIPDYDPRVQGEQAKKQLGHTSEKSFFDIVKNWIVIKAGTEIQEWGMIEDIYEPIADVEIIGPTEYTGNIMTLVQEYRGVLKHMEQLDVTRTIRRYDIPLGEIIIDFNDRLKSVTRGYATMNYEYKSYQQSNLQRLDILVNGEKIEAFSLIVHQSKAYTIGNEIVTKLKTLIPRHLFPIPLQAAIGGRVIARENISAIRKDVTAKCYGGDISRKRKLLQKQKEGKKKMKEIGNVSIPSDIFIKMIARS